MLNERLIVQTTPQADEKNIVYWRDYRVTVLTDRLFRLEKSEEKRSFFMHKLTKSLLYLLKVYG